MAELIAALVPIRGLLTFLTDMNRFLGPRGGTVWLCQSLLPSPSRLHGSAGVDCEYWSGGHVPQCDSDATGHLCLVICVQSRRL